MARNPKKSPAPRSAKKAAPKKPPAKKSATSRKAKHGGTVVTKTDIDQAAASGAEAQVSTTKLPGVKFLNDFVKVVLPGFEADMVSSRGDIGSAIATAVEKNHVEKRALAIVRRIHKMPDKKFAETWEHLQHYFDALGFQKRYDDMPKLDLKHNGEPTEGEGEEAADGNSAEGAGDSDAPKMTLVDPPAETLADAMHEHLQRDEAAKSGATTH